MNKEPQPEWKIKGLTRATLVQCAECGSVYTGETSRTLQMMSTKKQRRDVT